MVNSLITAKQLPARRRRQSARGYLALLGCLLAIAAVFGTGAFLLPQNERIATGVTILGAEIGGLTRAEAGRRLETALASTENHPIELAVGAVRRRVTLPMLGIALDEPATLRSAYLLCRTGSIIDRVHRAFELRRDGLTLQPVVTLDHARAEALLESISTPENVTPTDASAHWDNTANKVVIIPEKVGHKLNMPAALRQLDSTIRAAIVAGKSYPTELTLPFQEKYSRLTALELAPVDSILSSFSTPYGNSSANRINNVEAAAAAINGTVLTTGEEFSFNDVVGPRDEDNGFLEAPVIVNGQMTEGIGGGICQVSTTLYNAVLLANLKVLQRNHHSLPSHYVSPGRDATVAWGETDFCFRNTMDTPVIIEAFSENRRLTVRLLGKGPAPVIQIVTSTPTSRPGHVIERKDPTLPAGARVVEKGTTGLEVTVYKVTGSAPDAPREFISHDIYRGQPTIIRLGSAPPLPPAISDQAGSSGVSQTE